MTEEELAKSLTKALAEALKPEIKAAVLEAFAMQEIVAKSVKANVEAVEWDDKFGGWS